MGSFVCYGICCDSCYMGNNYDDKRMERERSANDRLAFHLPVITLQHSYLKRVVHMAQIKWWAYVIMDLFGLPFWLLGILKNLDNIKSSILFLVGLIYAMSRLYFYVVQRRQAVREKELNLWHQEQDKQDRIKKSK